MDISSDLQAAQRPLVYNTKYVNTKKPIIDHETGEIQGFTSESGVHETLDYDHTQSLISKYALQNVSAQILRGFASPRSGEFRVVGCTRRRISDDVVIVKSQENNRASYKNLMVCGSVWTCPVCAIKISEVRKAEIQAAIDLHASAGGSMYMATYTMSHSKVDFLTDLLGSREDKTGIKQALYTYRSSRSYEFFKKFHELVGIVRCLEVTYSNANGWHPHIHELWFLPKALTNSQFRLLKSSLFDAWRSACIKAGLSAPNRKHGLDIKRSFSAAEYLSKFGKTQTWGTSSELSKAHSKTGTKSCTPWDFLRLHDTNPEQFTELFREYAHAFFGSRQVFWSKGLKSAFGINELSDEQAALVQDKACVIVTSISKEQWSRVLASSYDVRANILRIAEVGGAVSVIQFLSSLP